MKQPLTTLVFLLSILTGLFIISAVFPKNGIHIGGNFHLTFAKPQSFLTNTQPRYANIDNILEVAEINTDTIEIDTSPEEIVIDTIRANANKLKQSITKIEFPNNNPGSLYPVFKSMELAKQKGKVVRIVHYGDSQIEGDRITSFLRHKLQSRFGGCGIGMVPVEQLYNYRFSIIQNTSGNWYRYPVYGVRDTTLTHNRYGLLANFGRFSPYHHDSSFTDTNTYKAWISFESSKNSYINTKTFEQCRLFYGYNPAQFTTELYIGDSLAFTKNHPMSESLQTTHWNFGQHINDIRIEFTGKNSPEIYGLALDGNSGVAVDNIAMRGSSGLIFTRMDAPLFAQMIKQLNVKLLILQFGGNVVPGESKSYKYYEDWLSAHLRWIKRQAPGIAIVVIGVADMSKKENNYYVSYQSVEKVRNAMKNAAFSVGAGYWDMYKAMGGKNSMPSWVFANPPLATTDFVHFNSRGARLIANMFYNALWYEYRAYLQNTGKEE